MRETHMKKRFVIGVDFGTLSARALLVDIENGKECATAEFVYPHAVMDRNLPNGTPLRERWALQHPADYTEALASVIPAVLQQAGVQAQQVAGVGIDFTACTLLALDECGTPLCLKEEFAGEPHAYAKLWKHHASQPQADVVTAVARERGEQFINSFGGKVSSEWAIPKILETLQEAPHVFDATARFCEAADWLSQVLCGKESRAPSFAGYKSFWQPETGYPSNDFYVALDKRLDGLIGSKIPARVEGVQEIAGYLNEHGAALTGLKKGTPLALPIIDAHAAMPAVGAVNAGDFVMILGTSACHLLQADKPAVVPGISGCVQDVIVPELTTFEAGQAAVGDSFAWFVKNLLPAEYTQTAKQRGISVHALLRERASALAVGESGLLALDWWNGNRSILNNADLSGVLVGLTLRTRPEEIYRALLEACAFGSRLIVETFEKSGLTVRDILAAGGIARKDPFMMQIYADVLGKPIRVTSTAQAGALGSAMYAAVAAGAYADISEASAHMAAPCDTQYLPDPEHVSAYDALYRDYLTLHDYFGNEENAVMARLLRGTRQK